MFGQSDVVSVKHKVIKEQEMSQLHLLVLTVVKLNSLDCGECPHPPITEYSNPNVIIGFFFCLLFVSL